MLIFLAEDSESAIRRRIDAIAKHRGLNLDKIPLYVFSDDRRLRIDDPEDLKDLRCVLKELQPKLLLLDPFIRIGRVDENSSKEVSEILDHIRDLQREFDMSVILTHHYRKVPDSNRASTANDLRGSGDLYAWVDSMILISKWKEEGEETYRLEASAEHREAESPEKFGLVRVKDERGRVRLEKTKVFRKDPANTLEQNLGLQERILQELQMSPDPLEAKSIERALGGSGSKIRAKLREMLDEGLVRKELGRYLQG